MTICDKSTWSTEKSESETKPKLVLKVIFINSSIQGVNIDCLCKTHQVPGLLANGNDFDYK